MSAGNEGKFAIIGIGCRMPPNANSLAGFWRFLMRGGNALKPIRKDRWDWRQYFDEDPNRPGKSYAPKAASLDGDLTQFDPLAFGMSPREATSLDPQQRMMLEVTWEAFEDAGVPLEKASASATGVFVGGFCLDHLVSMAQPSNRHLINAHSPGGVMMTVLSNRISHAFNLRGPSLTLDTACSSSLVALHYACQSLRLRECDMALAGGVNAMLRPEFPIMMSKGHFLSHHGECHAFDETAAGYARGEGAGILLLKRLEDALAAGDTIHAVVRASGVNQDGHTDGISLPNSSAQEALAREVYRRAGLAPGEVDYVEAHGTGTQAGDSAELGALNRNFAEGRSRRLFVGSVKTNIGHLEAAAGVAGVLKVIGVLKNRQVPKNLHFKQPNPKIPFAEYTLEVAGDTKTLPSFDEKPTLYVGINSFGYGGTNAHIVFESAPPDGTASAVDNGAPLLIPFSAHNEVALRDLAGKFAFLLGQKIPGTLADLAYTAAYRRSHLPQRLVVSVSTLDELREQLIAASTGQPHEKVVAGTKAASTQVPLVFVFTGMGPQWWGMGQELFKNEPLAAAALDEIDGYFQPLAGWSLKEAMLATEADSRMAHTEVAQPANFAIQVALTRLWEARGIRPVAVVGHSVGEVTAAYVAGVYTLEEAVRVSYHRSHLQQSMAGQGSMLAVGLPETEAEALIAGFPSVSIAAINSFSAVTLSGDTEPLKQLAADLEARGVFNKFLRVEVAYHSPQMEPLREELFRVLGDLKPRPATLPLYSTAHGRIVPGESWDAGYWWQNVRHAVRFASATQHLIEDGYATFLEVGPHPVLGNSIKECAATLGRKVVCFTSLRRAEPERPRMLATLAELYCAGVNPDWSVLAPTSGRFIPGPQYPWQRQHYWVESERSRMERLGLPGPVYLNRTVVGPTPCWEVEINRNYFPFLFDHGVQDQTVFAGMGYIEAALALNRAIHGTSAVVLENVSFERVLIVDYAKLQYLLTEFDAGGGRFNISSRVEGEEGNVQRHCRGRMFPQLNAKAEIDLEPFRAECTTAVSNEAFHERLHRRELHYGPAFTQPVADVRVGESSFIVKIDASVDAGDDARLLHPAVFDAALRAVLYCASGERLFVPFSFEQFQYFSRPESPDCYACGRLISQSDTLIVADVWLTDASGRIHAHARRLSLQAIEIDAGRKKADLFYQLEWKEAPLEPADPVDGATVAILADESDSDMVFARALAAALPGSELVSSGVKGADAFGRNGMADLLGGLSGRRHLLVLCGSKPADAEASIPLNEKMIGFLQAAAEAGTDSLEVTFVTRGARAVKGGAELTNLPASTLSALGLVAQNESENLMCRSLDLESTDDRAVADVIAELASASRGDVAVRGGQRLELVLGRRREKKSTARIEKSVEEPVELQLGVKGRLDSLHFAAGGRREPGAGEVELRVHQVAIHEKDLQKIQGHLHPAALEKTLSGTEFGMACAGVVERCGSDSAFSPGDRIVAMARGAFKTHAIAAESFAWKIPDGLGMEACAIPFDYLTAYRGLVDLAGVQKGERVLIADAAGGLGCAAIDVARALGAEVLALVSTDSERDLLQAMGLENACSLEGDDFARTIHARTDGEGVDVFFGALPGRARAAALALLRTGGRYIETGKQDLAEDLDLPLRAFNRNVLFASLDVDRLAEERPVIIHETFAKILQRFASGDFHLVAGQLFAAGEFAAAFQAFAPKVTPGSIRLDLSSGTVEVSDEPARVSPAKADGCYVITGGTSGFGLATARWLAGKGAGKIILVSRSGMKAPGIEAAVRELSAGGARIEVVAGDVSNAEQMKALLEAAATAPFVLRGIVHGAMVLDDAMMKDLSVDSFRRVFLPKAAGALNLASLLPGVYTLDFLLFYSSVSAIVGNRGQTSYVVANSLLDALAHSLRGRGIPATSINWGALAESGVVARDEHLVGVLSSAGIVGLTDNEAFRALEEILQRASAQEGAFKVDWSRWFESHPKLADDSRFRVLALQAQDSAGGNVAAQLRKSLAEASKEGRLRVIEEMLQETLATTLKMAKEAAAVDRKLNDLGVDSLMVLELGLGIEERIGIRFSAMELLKGPTLQQLAAMAYNKLWKS